jgi:ankyrin repeat protein
METLQKPYYYHDDYIRKTSNGIERHPRLIWTDLYSRIIENEPFKILKQRTEDISKFKSGNTLSKSPDFRFVDYSTPLLLACYYYKKLDYIEYLLKNNANINYKLIKWPKEENVLKSYNPNNPSPFCQGMTPLMSIITSENICKKQIIKYMIEKGADVNNENEFGDTPLMYACYFSNVEIVSMLIENGAYINSVNIHNMSPLCLSFLSDNFENVKEILRNDGDISQFLRNWPSVNSIIDMGEEELSGNKHEIFYFIRTYNEHKANFISRIFPPGISDPLRMYITNCN